MSLFRKRDAVADFWEWVVRNKSAIEAVKTGREPIMGQFEVKLRAAAKGLVWEAGRGETGFELIISADGIRDRIPLVHRVVDAAPEIPGWRVIAFRQPKTGLGIVLNGRKMHLDDIYWADRSHSADGPADLVVFVDGLQESNRKQVVGLCFMMLDVAIGELAVMTRLGALDFLPLTLADGTQRPLTELGSFISSRSQSHG